MTTTHDRRRPQRLRTPDLPRRLVQRGARRTSTPQALSSSTTRPPPGTGIAGTARLTHRDQAAAEIWEGHLADPEHGQVAVDWRERRIHACAAPPSSSSGGGSIPSVGRDRLCGQRPQLGHRARPQSVALEPRAAPARRARLANRHDRSTFGGASSPTWQDGWRYVSLLAQLDAAVHRRSDVDDPGAADLPRPPRGSFMSSAWRAFARALLRMPPPHLHARAIAAWNFAYACLRLRTRTCCILHDAHARCRKRTATYLPHALRVRMRAPYAPFLHTLQRFSLCACLHCADLLPSVYACGFACARMRAWHALPRVHYCPCDTWPCCSVHARVGVPRALLRATFCRAAAYYRITTTALLPLLRLPPLLLCTLVLLGTLWRTCVLLYAAFLFLPPFAFFCVCLPACFVAAFCCCARARRAALLHSCLSHCTTRLSVALRRGGRARGAPTLLLLLTARYPACDCSAFCLCHPTLPTSHNAGALSALCTFFTLHPLPPCCCRRYSPFTCRACARMPRGAHNSCAPPPPRCNLCPPAVPTTRTLVGSPAATYHWLLSTAQNHFRRLRRGSDLLRARCLARHATLDQYCNNAAVCAVVPAPLVLVRISRGRCRALVSPAYARAP